MTKPTVDTDKQDYLTPDMDFLTLMGKAVFNQAAYPLSTTKNLYNGSVTYRILGSTSGSPVEATTEAKQAANIAAAMGKIFPVKDFDLEQMTADPFHDAAIDDQRVKNRGVVPFTDVASRVTLFMQSDGLYNVVFDTTTDHKIKASFLLRVDLSKTSFKNLKHTQLTKNAQFDFKFTDRENLRGPVLVRAASPRAP
jgi:hypothetical protein